MKRVSFLITNEKYEWLKERAKGTNIGRGTNVDGFINKLLKQVIEISVFKHSPKVKEEDV